MPNKLKRFTHFLITNHLQATFRNDKFFSKNYAILFHSRKDYVNTSALQIGTFMTELFFNEEKNTKYTMLLNILNYLSNHQFHFLNHASTSSASNRFQTASNSQNVL